MSVPAVLFSLAKECGFLKKVDSSCLIYLKKVALILFLVDIIHGRELSLYVLLQR